MSGHNDLFETLYRDYQPMVRQLCLGFVQGNRAVADDLSQEVFINTWQALPRFNHAASPKTWIYRITVNTCLKYIRDGKKGTPVSIDETHAQLPDEPGPATETAYQALYGAIGRLGEVDRLILMMVLDELDYGEIATILGISEGALRVKIHRIKKNLKKILENG